MDGEEKSQGMMDMIRKNRKRKPGYMMDIIIRKGRKGTPGYGGYDYKKTEEKTGV